MFEDPAAWCADRAPGQQFPADALPLDVRQLQNSALPLQVTHPACHAILKLHACSMFPPEPPGATLYTAILNRCTHQLGVGYAQ